MQKDKTFTEDKFETCSASLNDHYKTPHSFVTYLEGKDNSEVRVLLDKENGYLFVGDFLFSDIWYLLDRVRKYDEEYIKVTNPSLRRRLPGILVNTKQLKRFLEENATCKFDRDRICQFACAFWYANDGHCCCLYKSCPTFREFAINLSDYVTDIRSRSLLRISSSCRFYFERFLEIEHWSREEGDVTFRDALKYRLEAHGHKCNIDGNGTLRATRGYEFFAGEAYEIIIDKEGNGLITASTETDEYMSYEDVKVGTMYQRGKLVEAMRELCVHFDSNIELVKKEEK